MNDQPYQAAIDACNQCAAACDHCAASCLHEDDVKSMTRCIALDMDCAQLCRLAAGAMARGSEHASAICKLCAELCEACAEECGRHAMEHCQQCAAACRDCAAACHHVVGMPAAKQGAMGAGTMGAGTTGAGAMGSTAH